MKWSTMTPYSHTPTPPPPPFSPLKTHSNSLPLFLSPFTLILQQPAQILPFLLPSQLTPTHSNLTSSFCAFVREYPCDHYTAIMNVTLLHTGCPRASIHETALQLLQVLDKRFFGAVTPLVGDAEGE